MPTAVFKSVREVSSEDDVHVAANLLQIGAGKKWKTKVPGEKSAYVILELQEEVHITGIDIGNEHSAFVEVLVAKAGSSSSNFVEILTTCSFMTPVESRNSDNVNRVRCFGKNALIEDAATQKWSMVKALCSQPFNKFVKYGLSFLKIHTADSANKNDSSVISTKYELTKPATKANTNGEVKMNTSLRLGNFSLIAESSDSESESCTGMFSRWKAARTGNSDLAQSVASTSKAAQSENERKPKFQRELAEKLSKQDETGAVKARVALKNQIKTDETRHDEKRKLKTKKETCKEEKIKLSQSFNTSDSELLKVKRLKEDEAVDATHGDKPRKRPSSPSSRTTKKIKLKDTVYRPFNKLLKDVVLVISGIQNPERADLRSKALEMGAKYKTNWDDSCTHLICAFKNTPKFKEVSGKGKIVTRSWIEKCYSMRRYLPWRRYALDTKDSNISESEEEVLDESLNAATVVTKDQGKRLTSPVNQKPMDTKKTQSPVKCDLSQADECQSVGSDDGSEDSYIFPTTSKVAIKECTNNDDNNIYEASTEEEDYLKEKKSSRGNTSVCTALDTETSH